MISFRDKILSQVLLQHNLVARESLQSCWASRQMDSVSGETSDLPQILISQGHLNDAQVDKLLRQIDSAIFFCMSCQENYFLPNVSPDSVVRCQKCQRSLDCLADSPIVTGGMFAHYLIQKELGRGGMGAVYEAYDTKLDRVVALKVILAGDQVNEKQLKRFLREAKSTAKLRHPNIVEVYEVGYTPQNYFTMEHVIGQSFSERIKQGRMSMKLIATIMKKSSEALHLAHKNNLIHRDIKPSNIMLTKDNDPKIMDFGLVKIVEADEKLSQSGQMMGTPAYMPPEQADGKNVSAKSDVYSLGATLYQALTGRPPFQGESYLNILRQVYGEEPLSPRSLNPDVPIELEAICLKCLEKKAFRRYHSAQELAKDLENYLQNKPIQAKPMTSLVKVRKLIARNKAITLVSVSALLLLSISLSLFVSQIAEKTSVALKALSQAEKNAIDFKEEKIRAQAAEKNAKEERDGAIVAKKAAEESRQEALQAVYFSSILLAQKYILDYQLPQAQGILNSHGAKNLRDWEWNWLKRRGNYETSS